MKKLILLIIVFLLSYSCEKKSKKNNSERFVINGTIKDISNTTKVYLKTQENGALLLLDSTIIKNEKFKFEGTVDRPSVYGIFVENIKGTIGIFIENKIITIEAFKDSLSSSKISGSKTNDEYLNFVDQSNEIISKMNILFPAFQKARAENDVKKLENINGKMQAINDENTAFAINYAKQHPNSYVSAFALYSVVRIPSTPKDTILKIYNNFSDYVKKGDFAIETIRFLETSIERDSIQN